MPAASLKPQDVLVALKLAAHSDREWMQKDLASSLGVSPAEVSDGMKRLAKCRLYSVPTKRISKASLLEFLLHGIRYVFPAEEGRLSRGTPTAWSAAPLRERILSNVEAVWPNARGETEGVSIEPLYPSVPFAATQDSELHELLALVDAIRAGRARERELARKELEKRLH